ncbi:MAG: glutamine-hydrolyzing carbamoyl-phosphate synthase small subunit [Gammaproteobacteria bacterium]|nr:glutamine-hydrolyzing carbamoyl-phosphate synthase small subunit [Gammaproteobacteria bacterium]
MQHPAILVLADGSVFRGISVGASGVSVGEVVFNTSMTGYQEILTDPSYAKQLVTLTYPHIGNVGCNPQDEESGEIHAGGLIVRDVPRRHSNFRATTSLPDYLQSRGVVGIAGIDTRRLTRVLRDKGAQNGCLMAGDIDEAQALKQAQGFAGLAGMDLAKVVSRKDSAPFRQSVWELGEGALAERSAEELPLKVVAYDFGIKCNIARILVSKGCDLTIVPAQTPAEEVLAMNPDGVFLSNGPGDPEPCDYAIAAIKTILDKQVPVFGICLGHQLLALASGAKTVKMKFGHHGANHPVQDLKTKRVMITSQNHGFAVDEESLPEHLVATHRSLFDQSLQGIERTDCPAFSFQGHPEASPGPQDLFPLFDRFIDMMNQAKA